MEKIRHNKLLISFLGTLAVLVMVIGALTVQKLVPSKKVMDLTKYYKVDSDKVMVVLQNKIAEEQGLYFDGVVYIEYETVKEYLNHRFYWDTHENSLIYTTQSEVIKTEISSNSYYVNKSKANVPYQIVKTTGDKVYVALEYVKLFSNIEYKFYEKPNRVVIQYDWKQEYMYSNVKKNTQLRYGASVKSAILVQLKSGNKLHMLIHKKSKMLSLKKLLPKMEL